MDWGLAPALAAASGWLRCPNCEADITPVDRALVCEHGHSFDVARHGYVSLLAPGRKPAAGDSEEMAASREAFLGAGHYAPIAAAVGAAARGGLDRHAGVDAESAADDDARLPGCIVDLGAGTGYYLGAALGDLDGSSGLALDSSRAALRRAVRVDPRIAGVVCDAWGPLPVRSAAADLVLSVFAPRQPAEIARILSDRGRLVVVTPAPQHLGELVSPLGMITIDPDKSARLHGQLSPHLRAESAASVEFEMTLDHEMVRAVAGMGPTAHHVGSAELRDRVSRLADPIQVTAAVIVETFRR